VGFSNLQGVNLRSQRNILILGFGLCKLSGSWWHIELPGQCMH
jgi:hypothetical protein